MGKKADVTESRQIANYLLKSSLQFEHNWKKKHLHQPPCRFLKVRYGVDVYSGWKASVFVDNLKGRKIKVGAKQGVSQTPLCRQLLPQERTSDALLTPSHSHLSSMTSTHKVGINWKQRYLFKRSEPIKSCSSNIFEKTGMMNWSLWWLYGFCKPPAWLNCYHTASKQSQ